MAKVVMALFFQNDYITCQCGNINLSQREVSNYKKDDKGYSRHIISKEIYCPQCGHLVEHLRRDEPIAEN